jgi:hypothetical protein
MIRIALYCTCGGALCASLRGGDEQKRLAEVKRLWRMLHFGAEHRDTDRKTAARARAKAERAAVRSVS